MHDLEVLPAVGVPLARGLARFGDRVAVVTADGQLSYRELAARVAAAGAQLGPDRRLVLIAGANRLEPLVVHLAALAAGHPVLLVPGDDPARVDEMVAAYDPDTTFRATDAGWQLEQRHEQPRHELHPDLALLLSTSGSSGSPKLVRLSRDNLQANAEAIAASLGIRETDRAATTLPLHYCYGLSVVHSHLARGAALLLTDLSVVDACFWDLFRRQRGTTLAGVPYTFDLLDRVGFADMVLPHLRYVTQAGGRLGPERVRAYAELGRRQGWDLFVMYGQTEATARMTCLPPDLALTHPASVGRPIPGGTFDIDDSGELVYRGPNVMLGYAESPADLRLGRTVEELPTGDLGRLCDDGLYEVVGRCSRVAKVVGLRVDLQRVEDLLATDGLVASCAAGDDELVVAVEGADDIDPVRRRIARLAGVPLRAVHCIAVDALPRLPSGKPDLAAVRTLAARPPQEAAEPPRDLRALFADVLDRPDVTGDSTFVSLGGDSLSYVELSVRLEAALGSLPGSWHTMPLRDLEAEAAPPTASWRRLETSIALRAVAIVLIVATHANVFDLTGGAHVLVAVAGYNFARFQLGVAERRDRVRRVLASLTRIAVPSVAAIGVGLVITERYTTSNLLLVKTLIGGDPGPKWNFWFIEALLHILVVVTALLALPVLDRLERRHAFGFALGLLGVGLVARYGLLGMSPEPLSKFTAVAVFWIFALGWAAAKATRRSHLVLLTGVIALCAPGLFTEARRSVFVVVGVALLLWLPTVPSTRLVNRAAGILASASLYIYVTHFLVYPHLENDVPLLAALLSFAVGLAYWRAVTHLAGVLRPLVSKEKRCASAGSPWRRLPWPSSPPRRAAAGMTPAAVTGWSSTAGATRS